MEQIQTYQIIDNIPMLTVRQWMDAGLTYDLFKNDSKRGYLTIIRRGRDGATLIDASSIKRSERLQVIEAKFGKVPQVHSEKEGDYRVEVDTAAQDYYVAYRTLDGSSLPAGKIREYTDRASVFTALHKAILKRGKVRAKCGKEFGKADFWRGRLKWHTMCAIEYNIPNYNNVRSFERAFNEYLKDGYKSIIHKNFCNDSARIVSASTGRLLSALWRLSGKPFIKEVHGLYVEFVSGGKELFDKETGEVFRPEDFRHKGRAQEISVSTVWGYLKDIVNEASVYSDRNGNFDYVNKKRPKHNRKLGRYSLSKISMDDVAMSRKSVRGWIYKYIAVDVVSGYWFRPAYIVGKPTIATVIESFRNMFCELTTLGLPMPGELEVEYHLMKDIHWLNDVFPFVRFCESPTEKRAEHSIKSLKYGAAHREGHTRGRWYAKHEAYRTVRNKVDGDFVEPEYQPQTIIADDLADIEKHNNELHPLQKTYQGMTRRQVFVAKINPNLKPFEHSYLYRFIGNEAETTIRNNDFCAVANEEFELQDYNSLTLLKPNDLRVMAYWLPDENGSIKKVYLYQDNTYIGEALNRSEFAYNENKIEQTEADEAGKLHQQKRIAQYDKFIKEKRAELPRIGTMDNYELQITNYELASPELTLQDNELIINDITNEYEYEFDAVAMAEQSI
jgi:hypothetical protein